MPRVKSGTTRRRRHKAVLRAAKGHRAARSTRYRVAKESVIHAMSYATKHRKLKKRRERSLAITRINAAVRAHGMSYSQFIHGITQAGVSLDRKSLAELAIREPIAFAHVAATARAAL